MYVLYEHHRVPGSTAVTGSDVLLSSIYPGTPDIKWWDKTDRSHADFLLNAFKQTVNTQSRVFDNDTKIWSFIGDCGERLLDKLAGLLSGSLTIQFVQVDDLAEQVRNHSVQPNNSRAKKFKAEDFYYNPNGTGSSAPELTKEAVAERLRVLMDIDAEDLKKEYRRAALKFHPDRNGGDGSKMSELNMLWRIYNQ